MYKRDLNAIRPLSHHHHALWRLEKEAMYGRRDAHSSHFPLVSLSLSQQLRLPSSAPLDI